MFKKTRIGIVGTGFIATGLFNTINNSEDFIVLKLLTRRSVNSITKFPREIMTNSPEELIEHSDIVFECSGDVLHATDVILKATTSGKKVVTMNSEFHVTAGSYFVKRGHYITEADGDQPGCLARLKLDLEGMGFEPIAYVNLKGYLDPNPPLERMKYYAEKQQLSLHQNISFTDGTKLQVEQALVANGLGAAIVKNGMMGSTVDTLSDLDYMVSASKKVGQPISEYVLCEGSPPGVLIVAKNSEADRLPGYLPFKRLRTSGDRAYVLLRPYHLVFLEALNTLRKIVQGEPVLLNNSAAPTVTVGAVTKRKMTAGEIIELGAGGFDTRGMAVNIKENKDVAPICLLVNTRVKKNLEPEQLIRFEDVEVAPSNALQFYLDGLK